MHLASPWPARMNIASMACEPSQRRHCKNALRSGVNSALSMDSVRTAIPCGLSYQRLNVANVAPGWEPNADNYFLLRRRPASIAVDVTPKVMRLAGKSIRGCEDEEHKAAKER